MRERNERKEEEVGHQGERTKNVPHLWRWWMFLLLVPTLTGWANFWRAYAALDLDRICRRGGFPNPDGFCRFASRA